jgi:PAS domain S-box-containing protein
VSRGDLEKLSQAADLAPVAIAYISCDKRFLYANRLYLSWAGRSWPDLHDRSLQEVLGSKAYAEIRGNVEGALSGATISYETSIDLPGLGVRHLNVSYTPDFDEERRVRGFVATIHDVTAAKADQAGQQLQYEVSQILGEALSLAGVAPVLKRLGLTTGSHAVQLWVPAPGRESIRCAQSWHIRDEALAQLAASCAGSSFGAEHGPVGKSWTTRTAVLVHDVRSEPDLSRLPFFASAGLRSALAVPITVRQVTVGVLEMLSRGSLAWDVTRRNLVSSIAGHIGQFLERLRLEEQLRDAHKMEAVGRLAGGIAHDFNNLLTVVVGHGEIATEELKEAEPNISMIAEAVQEILAAADRASYLTRQLLAFGRRQMIRPTVLDLCALVEQWLPRLRAAMPENIAVITKPCDQSKHVQVNADQIGEVLMNLATNARDAMPQGGEITLALDEATLDEGHSRELAGALPGRYVLLSMSDTGRGMDFETQKRIFEPFFSTRGPAEKRGLGLAVVYGVVKQSSGHIWVYSEPGHGTTFKMYFPRVSPSTSVPPPPVTPTLTDGSNKSVLIVDDDRHLRRLVSQILREQGYTVIEAKDAEEALRIASSADPIDLVLSDVTMPGIKGPELIQLLRKIRPNLRALLMSGYTEDFIHDQGFIDHAVPFLSKPFSKEDLILKIASLTPQD